MNTQIVAFLLCFVGAGLFVLFVAWLTGRFGYRITDRGVEVTLCGICVRRVLFTDIESISRHSVSFGEHWWNTGRPFRRILVIRRRSGLIRNFVITPLQRYVFKAQLERAIARAGASAPVTDHLPEDEPALASAPVDDARLGQ